MGILRSFVTPPNLASCTRKEVLEYFDNGWAITEMIFSALQGEAAFLRSPYHRLRHPLIFYYAHPAAFYVNKLRLAGLHIGPLDPELETLFQAGVDEMSWDDLSQSQTDWPPVARVTDYRRQAYRIVRGVVDTHSGLDDGHPRISLESPLWALFMCFEHERIHHELSSVLVREHPVALVHRPPAWPPNSPRGPERTPENPLLPFAGKSVLIGKPRNWASFGWDNEYGERQVHVRPFRASRHMVSNGEFLEFVASGGYADRRRWSDEGWKWRAFRNAGWPAFWVADGPAGLHRYRLRTLFEVVDMPWSWPVLVNFHEAHTYCEWRRERDASAAPYRVLTEAEHHCLRDSRVDTTSGHPPTLLSNVALAHGSEGPVDGSKPTAAGAFDVFGNAWEWCEDHFNPLPGFKVHPYYDDFSSPCFDGKHQMVLGASFISSGDEASVWARFHFRPHFLQQCGFRVACSGDGDPACDAVHIEHGETGANVYEAKEALDQYMALHYGDDADCMPYSFGPKDALHFPRRCAELVIHQSALHGVHPRRALDVGCAVGGASFELARQFEEVLGVDLSVSFIAAANSLKRDGTSHFQLREEGEIATSRLAMLDPSLDRTRVTFRQADACALPAELRDFDVVLLANLLCRLPSPRACLERMGGPRGIVRPGGLLVIVSPYTWMDAFTPRDVWLGGYAKGDSPTRSIDGLHALLDSDFALVDERDMPLLIREHARKFQYIVSHATVWKRR